jgi:hypothetical protein
MNQKYIVGTVHFFPQRAENEVDTLQEVYTEPAWFKHPLSVISVVRGKSYRFYHLFVLLFDFETMQ